MKNIIKDKRGIEAIVLIGAIILVMSIAAIFLIFRDINLKKEIDRDVCHQSVVLRAAPFGEKALPLRCKTSYICIGKDKTNCESFENLQKKEIEEVTAKTEEEINRAVADQLYTAWTMFGKGKLNFMPKDWGSERYCFISSTISFDDSIKNDNRFKNGIKGLDVVLATQAPEGQDKSYLYLFNEGEIDSLVIDRENPAFSELINKLEEGGFVEIREYSLNPEYNYDLVYIIDKKGHLSWTQGKLFWLGAGIAVTGVGVGVAVVTGWTGVGLGIGATLIVVGKAVIISAEIVAGGVAVSTISVIRKGEDANHELTLVRHDKDLEGLKSIGCTSFETL